MSYFQATGCPTPAWNILKRRADGGRLTTAPRTYAARRPTRFVPTRAGGAAPPKPAVLLIRSAPERRATVDRFKGFCRNGPIAVRETEVVDRLESASRLPDLWRPNVGHHGLRNRERNRQSRRAGANIVCDRQGVRTASSGRPALRRARRRPRRNANR
jgi:hypothetical protein